MACHSFVCREHQSSLWRIHSINLFVNFCWTFTFCIEKLYDRTHFAFGWTLDQHCHFKHISLKQNQLYHCHTSMAPRFRIKVDGNVVILSIKNFLIGLHVMDLYFPDMLRTVFILLLQINQQKQSMGSSQ
jgi:hypothetical protein